MPGTTRTSNESGTSSASNAAAVERERKNGNDRLGANSFPANERRIEQIGCLFLRLRYRRHLSASLAAHNVVLIEDEQQIRRFV